MRKKEIVFEGQTFTISPLKVAQVDELYAGASPEETAKLSRADINSRGAGCIAHSFNNAAGNSEWSVARVLDELDFPTFNFVHQAVMDFMGWKTPDPTQKKSDATPS